MRFDRPLMGLVVLIALVSFGFWFAIEKTGIGSRTPPLSNTGETALATAIRLTNLVQSVTCDVISSVQKVLIFDEDQAGSAASPPRLAWLKSWTANIKFLLTVDDSAKENPSARVCPLGAQSGCLGLATEYSSEATRDEGLTVRIDFKDYSDSNSLAKARQTMNGESSKCKSPDIGFLEWLHDATMGQYVINQQPLKIEGIEHKVKFVVVHGGSVAPTIKFVNVEAGSDSKPLLGAKRGNTQEIAITLAPPSTQGGKP